MGGPTRPKFFREASAERGAGGVRLLLDGRPVKTPKGRPLLVPSPALGQALATEWNALEDKIDPAALPLTKLVNTAIDGVTQNRDALIADLARYAGCDLVCYRCAEPEALAARQTAAWDPLLDWAAQTHGAALLVTTSIMHQPQPDAALGALTQAVLGHDDFPLTGLHLATGLTGSLVIALALAAGRFGAEEAWAAATVDESYQAELWGIDEEAQERRMRLAAELALAERFLRLLDA